MKGAIIYLSALSLNDATGRNTIRHQPKPLPRTHRVNNNGMGEGGNTFFHLP